MSYTITNEKEYPVSAETAYAAALKAIAGLEGKLVKQEPADARIKAKFHKTIHGKVLGDRTELQVHIEETDGGCKLHSEIYPLDAVGRKLQFGARKGVSATVLSWFNAHMDHHLA